MAWLRHSVGSLALISFLLVLDLTIGKSFIEDVTLKQEERSALDEFKARVISRMPQDYMKKDIFLIRWLRAKDFNMDAAEGFLMNHLQWREDNNMDKIHEEDWSDLKRNLYYDLEGRDKEGRPILYAPLGQWDARRALITGNPDRIHRYKDMILEEACGLVRELGEKYKNVSQGILIVNAKGYNLVQHGCIQCLTLMLDFITSYETHHPGCGEKIIFLNVPAIAEPLIRVGKNTVVDRGTSDAVTVIGTNTKKVRDFLSRYIDKDQLPIDLGGTRELLSKDYD